MIDINTITREEADQVLKESQELIVAFDGEDFIFDSKNEAILENIEEEAAPDICMNSTYDDEYSESEGINYDQWLKINRPEEYKGKLADYIERDYSDAVEEFRAMFCDSGLKLDEEQAREKGLTLALRYPVLGENHNYQSTIELCQNIELIELNPEKIDKNTLDGQVEIEANQNKTRPKL